MGKVKRLSFFCLFVVMMGLILCVAGNLVVQTKTVLAESTKAHIGRVSDYLEIDRETVRFLPATHSGAQVCIYLGTERDKLELATAIEHYYPQAGIELGGFEPGVVYYYKVIATYNGKSAESEVFSFIKTDPRPVVATPPEWARTSVFYEIFVRSFYDGDNDGIGDFKGLREKIGYLKELGIDAVWLMPCFASPSYHGYDVVDYCRINPDYGTNEDFWAFLTAAHEQGIKVILDLAFNHTSTGHPWFMASVRGRQSKYRGYYFWAEPYEELTPGPWGQNIWHQYTRAEKYMGLFGPQMPDLNLRNPEVREELKKIAGYWLDPNGDGDPSDGVDGFRLDAAMHIDHVAMEVTHRWWQEFNAYVKLINPEAFLVGENMASMSTVAPFYGDLDSSFNFDLAERMIYVAGGRYRDLLAIIADMHKAYAAYNPDFIDSTFLSNHDQNRVATQLAGNINRMKLAAALLLTLPGTPFIYYGEELGQGGAKPDEHIREPFDWYAAAEGPGMTDLRLWTNKEPLYTQAFDGISVEEQEEETTSLLNHYRKLIRLRKEHPAFFNGRYERLDTPQGTYGYSVAGDTYLLWVIHNYQTRPQTIRVEGEAIELLSSQQVEGEVGINPLGTIIIKYDL
ncbi:MAG TPA: alpha-amylase family glycosyl hydrolase [Bacillota bacterium]